MSDGTRFISYFRVSTVRQGRSGLGIEAQRQAVAAYLTGRKPLAEFLEVESGRKSDRPMLAQALAACRVHRAVLVIAKLDRLARNVSFVSALMDSGVEFVACDFPQANRLTIHILAAVAENETRLISERTRAALAAAKARGRTLGGFRGRAGTCTDLAKARAVRALAARSRAIDLAPIISQLRLEGIHSLRGIAAVLNDKGITACRGGKWSAAQVKSVLSRINPGTPCN
ncbi:recombinase family protein [Bradyrhizobium huanghuaihaiense]|nr:recombinase family protein [Bradyrhizobium sp. CB3035]